MKNKVLTALLAAVIAIGLWGYVITVERPEADNTFYNVPVVLSGERVLQDRGMMITSNTELTVTVKLTGNRRELNKLRSSDMAAVLDLSQINEAGERRLRCSVEPPSDNIDVVSIEPEAVVLTVTQWATKEIPVELTYAGRVPDGYYVDKQNASLEYQTVSVTGPKEIISRIEKAKITLDLEGRIETVSEDLRYALCDSQGDPIEDVSTVTTDRGQIKVGVSIQQLKEVKLTYTVTDGGGLTAADVSVKADYDTVTVAGSAAALLDLEELNLGTVDLGELTESTELVMPIELPENVTNQSGYTVVHLQVELPELEIREYTVTKFRTDHTPQGHTAQMVTQQLVVKLRGRKPVLDRIKPENITAIADLTGLEPGVHSLSVRFDIQGFNDLENLGAVEKYTVTVRVLEQAPVAPASQTTP